MPKTPEYQLKASQNYRKRLEEAGYKQRTFYIRPEWALKIRAFIASLDKAAKKS